MAGQRWTRRHHGFGPAVRPYDDGDPGSSWEHCPARDCRQLFRGRLWKCSPITYLRLQKETFPTLSDEWDPYLAYDGLAATCTDADLSAFLDSEAEPICGMCPSRPERFDKDSPLISRASLMRAVTR
jgi:hypothetical protein